jgi:hypothetical protein
VFAPVKQSDGSAYYVQNATGEKFFSGDTVLTFVDTLTSSDIESIENMTTELLQER